MVAFLILTASSLLILAKVTLAKRTFPLLSTQCCVSSVLTLSLRVSLSYNFAHTSPIRPSMNWEQNRMPRTCLGSSSPGSIPSSRLAPQRLSTKLICQSCCPNYALEPSGPNFRSSRTQGMDSDLCFQTKASFLYTFALTFFAPVPPHLFRLSTTAQFECCGKGGKLAG